MRCLSPSIVLSLMLLAVWLPMASAPAAEIVTITPQILEAAALTQAAAGQAVASDGAEL